MKDNAIKILLLSLKEYIIFKYNKQTSFYWGFDLKPGPRLNALLTNNLRIYSNYVLLLLLFYYYCYYYYYCFTLARIYSSYPLYAHTRTYTNMYVLE